ncbi:MAG: hypothetical protein JWR80_891 [Bradyrhizobium sp.]|nr:hypothetical protein [Bradyrhizobium sp.]
MAETRVICASHSPLMYCATSEPLAGPAICDAFKARADEVEDFRPDVIFAFGPDHYTSMFNNMAPMFCIGTQCEAIEDIGGFGGRLNVPSELAMECIVSVHDAGVDVAVSHDLKIDHGISQTLHRVAGGVSAYPTIPVLINILTHPLPPFRRSRLLGEAIGVFAKARGLRVLFVGSGGLSHNPKRIFPSLGEGGPLVDDHMRSGPGADPTRQQQWLERQHDIHVSAAEMLSDGRLTGVDCMFNAEADHEQLEIIARGDLAAFDSWDPNELIQRAGIGSVELHAWIAACAAHAAAGGNPPRFDLYHPVVEYGVAVGMVHA